MTSTEAAYRAANDALMAVSPEDPRAVHAALGVRARAHAAWLFDLDAAVMQATEAEDDAALDVARAEGDRALALYLEHGAIPGTLVDFALDDDHITRLDKVAQRRGITRGQLVMRLLELGLEGSTQP